MMKKVGFALIFLCCGVFSIEAAEISEKQDIAIFGITHSAYTIPDDVLEYAESSINYVFINLKRFNVLGYGEYRMETGDIDDFVKRIREIRSEKAKEAGTYDEKFGTLVIKGEDFDRIVNSFIVVLPSLSNYSVGRKRSQYILDNVIYVKSFYAVDVVIDINFVNVREGTQQEAIRITGTGESEDLDRANSKAVENAISGLPLKIRQLEAFKIRSGVIQVRGDTVTFAQGENLGLKPGDEFEVMTKQEVGNSGRIVELPTGLVRAKKVYPEITQAHIIMQKEKITEGDQLVEISRFGAQVGFQAGVMEVDIPAIDYRIALVDDSQSLPVFDAEYYFISLDQKEKRFVPDAGVRLIKSLGYRLSGVVDLTALINFPFFGGIGEIGVGSSFYKRRLSIELMAQGGLLYMTTFAKALERNFGGADYLDIEGTRISYNQYPTLRIYGISVGVKGGTGLVYRISPGASVRLALGYRLYTPIKNWTFHIEETAGSSKNEVNIKSDSSNIYEVDGGSTKKVDISGFEGKLSLNIMF
jgi:hypothetical protein